MDLKTTINSISSKLENNLLWKKYKKSKLYSRLGNKSLLIAGAFLILIAGGGFAYYKLSYLPSQTTATSTLQTATARTGDLVIYASGTGTLSADTVDLAFKTSSQVEAIYFKVGDEVKKGDLLAEVDDANAQIEYTQARRNLLELTSPSATAAAQQAVASAQSEVYTAINQLSYLISPAVYYWETEVDKATQEVESLKTSLQNSPNDEEIQRKLKEREAYLDFAEDKLKSNKYYYKHEYLAITFTTVDRSTHTKYVAEPTDADIMSARAGLTEANAKLQEAQDYYTALTGGEVPENATGSDLTTLETAKLNLESAQATLDGTKIIAPISGTIMSIDTTVGDTAGTGTVVTVADLSHPFIEVFLDPSDWVNIALGYPANVTFDILPDKIYTGEVTEIDPGLFTEGNTSVVRALAQLKDVDKDFNIPLGASAAVDVIAGEAKNAVLVPIEALHQAGDKYTVFVDENGKLTLRVVEVGIQDLTYAEIKSGLKSGEVVSTGVTATK
jgi:multidrug efflux pump subunit AcrA (membrane-fusion protein)